MAAIALVTTGVINVVDAIEPFECLPAGVDVTAGQLVRENTSGNWILANTASTGNALGARLALRTVKAGEALAAARHARLSGFDFTNQAFDANIYGSDAGGLADAAGTVSVIAGRIEAVAANKLVDAKDKILHLLLPM